MSGTKKGIVYFVGAGPGDPELITLKGKRMLEEAGLVLYAGSLVNKEVLNYVSEGVPCHDTAVLTLEQTIELIREGIAEGKTVIRLHTGDPSLYGAIQEQIEELNKEQIPWSVVPGVSSFLAAAALLGRELTVPGGTQTVMITRQGGRTPVPERESLRELGAHGSTICLFLSASLLDEAAADLMVNLPADTPVAIVEKASWPDECFIMTTLAEMAAVASAEGIRKTAMILIGDFLKAEGNRSLLYDPYFSHGYRG